MLTTQTLAVSPAEHVLSIVELCEAILLFAEPADVLRCQRVNKALHTTITHPKPLRRRLFLEPDEGTVGSRIVNPLTPGFFTRQSGYRPSTIAARIDFAQLWAAVSAFPSPQPQPQPQPEQKPESSPRPPSWHGMQIAQPPATSCAIPTGLHSTAFLRHEYPAGMTFGDLERAILAAHKLRRGSKLAAERLSMLTEYTPTVMIYWQ